MVQFEQEDLYFKDYANTLGEYPDYTSIEDLEVLCLSEKFHVIFFCDSYLKRYRLDKTVQNFQKVEKIIKGCPALHITIKELYGYVNNRWANQAEALALL